MIVKRGTFIFSCKNKAGIPMTLDKCKNCKSSKICELYSQMKIMANEMEHELKEESMYKYETDVTITNIYY